MKGGRDCGQDMFCSGWVPLMWRVTIQVIIPRHEISILFTMSGIRVRCASSLPQSWRIWRWKIVWLHTTGRTTSIAFRTQRGRAASNRYAGWRSPLYYRYVCVCVCVCVCMYVCIIIIYSFTVIGLLPGGSGYFTCKQNMKLVTTRFKSGGLYEKHVMATWNLGNHLSFCL